MIAGSGSAPRSPARAAASAALRTSGEAGVEAGFADELSFAEPLVRIAARAIARGWNISLLGCLSTELFINGLLVTELCIRRLFISRRITKVISALNPEVVFWRVWRG